MFRQSGRTVKQVDSGWCRKEELKTAYMQLQPPLPALNMITLAGAWKRWSNALCTSEGCA
jgi:hypothetical protein